MAKAQPGEVSFGSSGNGSTGHVAAEMFMRMTGTRLLHVTYKGNAQALVDVMGGQISDDVRPGEHLRPAGEAAARCARSA